MTNTEFLPPLLPLGPLRISGERLDGHPSYATLLAEAATTGCCPVWVTDPQYLAPPDDPHEAVAAIDRIDPAEFLAEHWTLNLGDRRDPFGDAFPGLGPARNPVDDPLTLAASSRQAGRAHLAVVPVSRPADVVAAVGWRGPCDYGIDLAGLGAVLRSWEDRFGAVVVTLDRAVLGLSVAAPPVTPDECLAVAAEHFAFCRDVDWEDPRPLRTYASGLSGGTSWRFWWD